MVKLFHDAAGGSRLHLRLMSRSRKVREIFRHKRPILRLLGILNEATCEISPQIEEIPLTLTLSRVGERVLFWCNPGHS